MSVRCVPERRPLVQGGAKRRAMRDGAWRRLCAALLSLVLVVGQPSLAMAAEDVSQSDLDAMARALGFVESLPRNTASIGVVYAPQRPDGAANAHRVAEKMATLSGQGIPALHARVIAADELAAAGHFDALFLMPGAASSDGASIGAAVRKERMLSVSNDPACLQARCCALFVRAEPRVEIVIDTAMADSVGARFSLIFAAMVRRQ
jgi:hypothetical protein